MSELENLRKKRGIYKAALTRLKTFIDNFDANSDSHAELAARLDKIKIISANFDNIQDEIEILTNENESDREEFENNYFEVLGKGNEILHQHSQSLSFGSNARVAGTTPLTNSPAPNENLQIKLPTINLPVYSGSYDEWLNFRDTFESLIHLNNHISTIQKLHYLRSSLKGDAAKVLHSLDTTEANYQIAWDLLKKRFENKRIIINNHLKAIFNLPALKSESRSGLQTLLDTVEKNLRALESLGQQTDTWDTIIVFFITSRFDSVTLRDWELTKFSNEIPTRKDLDLFLQERCRMLDVLQRSNNVPKHSNKSFSHVATSYVLCNYCNSNNHATYSCTNFIKLTVNQRILEAQKLKLCLNCLRKNHIASSCKFGSCRICKKRHHSLLHIFENDQSTSSNADNTDSKVCTNTYCSVEQPVSTSCNAVSNINCSSLLATAIVGIADQYNNIVKCRALLDCGSQSNFMTNETFLKLGLQSKQINSTVCGVGQDSLKINKLVTTSIQSIHNNFSTSASFLILPTITSRLPTISLDPFTLQIPVELQLADPNYFTPESIDILIGVSTFWNVLTQGQIKLGKNLPTLQNTQFGWIISGPLPKSIPNKSFCHFSREIQTQLEKFWESEEISAPINHAHVNMVETHFVSTTTRASDGRFIVSLPFKQDPACLGDTRSTALKRFYLLENRLMKNPDLKLQYQQFMSEYLQLHHMSPVKSNSNVSLRYFLPHHPVIKNSSTSTKLRVVFDASAKSSNTLSLNDIQLIGPTIQEDLLSIILRFRLHRFVMSADITKMYRQIWVNEKQRNLQTILWRNDPSDPLLEYELNTVTYGMAAAPFLAVRCLYELSNIFKSKYPQAASIITQDFYIDDLLTGTDTIEDLTNMQNQLSEILESAGFVLTKWQSNALHNMSLNLEYVQLGKDDNLKTLGIHWLPKSDNLCYFNKLPDFKDTVTKRSILSNSAKLFDPLGLIAPITINAKIILQRLWQLSLDWDEPVPIAIIDNWNKFLEGLKLLHQIHIPRHVVCLEPDVIQLHGFCDASEQAYGACIYIRSVSLHGRVQCNLLCAKTRVAPLKVQTIPRLELCSALLLTRLVTKVKKAIKRDINQFFYWTDSQITLTWIQKENPAHWKTYVANRVSEIITHSSISNWHHVKGSENPADILTRGKFSQTFKQQSNWWHGPSWLNQEEHLWPITNYEPVKTPPDIKIALPIVTENVDILFKFSSLVKLLNTVSYCNRFINNCRVPAAERKKGNLTVAEVKFATNILIKQIQNVNFTSEILDLKSGRILSQKSKILQLAPFLDENQILRVGGRLKNSNYHFNKRHPILLPANHPLTKLLILHEHKALLHAGPQAVLSSIRQRYWPLSGRNIVKQVIRNCVTCWRVNPSAINVPMGELPSNRVTPARPFLNVGIDYAGPILIKDRKLRNAKLIKSYICIFICFSTKAIHIELVTSLTTDAFLATFRRFISRRGRPVNLYSDNGTQFIGASKELGDLFKTLHQNVDKIINSLKNEEINWHFIPPRSPHFGGLWEAGIKSVKHHLKRVIGNTHLTYEDLSTVLVQIEACLNSRPISTMSNDPNDLHPLTPGHFLIGEPLTSIPDPDLTKVKDNRLKQYQRFQKLLQHFWNRWSVEYITQLQHRSKWNINSGRSIALNSLVLIREDYTPPLQWHMGRVIKLHNGADGIPRVATIKTQNGEIKRAVRKLCIFPTVTVPNE